MMDHILNGILNDILIGFCLNVERDQKTERQTVDEFNQKKKERKRYEQW